MNEEGGQFSMVNEEIEINQPYQTENVSDDVVENNTN